MTNTPGAPQLLRAIGRWSMVALAINSILGSGIFGLPSVVAGLLGRWSPLAMVLAAGAMGVIIACYAEVASQFTGTGGTYLYLREVFGRGVGLQVGWITLLSRLTACAAAVNLLVVYLGEFWPAATEPGPRLLVITLFIGILAVINYRGVGAGAAVSNAAVVAKVLGLGVVCVAGGAYLSHHAMLAPLPVPVSADSWLKALLLLLFAYGGYEAALNPMGEARDPRRDVAFALFIALLVVAALYSSLQAIVIGTLADAARSARPLADAARVVMGSGGATFVALAALVSVYGYISANLLTVPRGVFALAAGGDFPLLLARVHPRFRTPYLAIAVFALLLWGFAQFAGFAWNLTLSAVARTLFYGGVCAAVPVLRRRQPDADAFRLPGGPALPVLGVAICALLLTRADFSKSVVLLVTVGIGLANWAAVRHRAPAGA